MNRVDAVSMARFAAAILERESEQQALEAAVAAAVSLASADHAGVTLVHGHGRELVTSHATDTTAERAGALQHELLQGPGVDAAFTGRQVWSSDVATDERWPQWTARAGRMGVGRVLSVPMHHEQRRVGALHVYGSAPGCFAPQQRELVGALARQAAVVVSRLRTEQDLDAGLDARTVVRQAQGIVMERFDVDAERALQMLHHYSQECDVTLRDLARQMIEYRTLPADPSPRSG